jgi:hypothetical protein
MTEQDKPTSTPQARAPEGMREKLTLAIVGFVLTGIVGGVLTTWIQQRGWAWQNRVATIEKDLNNVIATYKSASELVSMRWHAAYRVVRALEREENEAAWNGVRADFNAADREWALHYANVAREVEFYADAPFGVDSAADLKKVWVYVCEGGKSKAMIETQSARSLFELVNHCQEQLKAGLDLLIDPALKGSRIDAIQRKAIIDKSYGRLDQLYRTNDALRCAIFDRAIAIRAALTSQSYWSAFLGIEAPTYRAARKVEDCL